MKSNYIFLLLIPVIIGVCFSSCQKDISTQNGFITDTAVTSAEGDSIYLSRMLYAASDAGIWDTSLRITFLYDNLKRVTTVLDSSHEPGYPDNYEETHYYYSGNDVLPYKMADYFNGLNLIDQRKDSTTHFYTYNGAGKIAVDSFITSSRSVDIIAGTPIYELIKNIQSYSYGSNQVYGFKTSAVLQSLNSTVTPYTRSDTADVDAAGNLLNNSARFYYSSGPGDHFYAIYSYDNHPSPYSKLNIVQTIPLFNSGDDDILLSYTPHNNVLIIHKTIYPAANPSYNLDENYTGQFIYNTTGLPRIVNDPDVTAPDAGRIIYFYKTL